MFMGKLQSFGTDVQRLWVTVSPHGTSITTSARATEGLQLQYPHTSMLVLVMDLGQAPVMEQGHCLPAFIFTIRADMRRMRKPCLMISDIAPILYPKL